LSSGNPMTNGKWHGHNRIRTCDFCRVKTALYR
jgi:hypothetical protein